MMSNLKIMLHLNNCGYFSSGNDNKITSSKLLYVSLLVK